MDSRSGYWNSFGQKTFTGKQVFTNLLLLAVGIMQLFSAYYIQTDQTYFSKNAPAQADTNVNNFGFVLYVLGGIVIVYAGYRMIG